MKRGQLIAIFTDNICRKYFALFRELGSECFLNFPSNKKIHSLSVKGDNVAKKKFSGEDNV